VPQQAEPRIARLRQQARRATRDPGNALEGQADQLGADNERRRARVQEAWGLAQAALMR
jgi:hypothetical protein